MLTVHAKPILGTAWEQKPGAAQSSGPGLDMLWDTSPPVLTFIQQTLPGTSRGQSLPSEHMCAREKHQLSPAHSSILSIGKGQG